MTSNTHGDDGDPTPEPSRKRDRDQHETLAMK